MPYIYESVEVAPARRPLFVRSNSLPHHRHHHHHHSREHRRCRLSCPEGCACITQDRWTDARNEYQTLCTENATLRRDLQTANDRVCHLEADNRRLYDHTGDVRWSYANEGDNLDSRRVADLNLELAQKNARILELEKNNKTLTTRVDVQTETIRAKDREIHHLSHRVFGWERFCSDFKATEKDLLHKLKLERRKLRDHIVPDRSPYRYVYG